MNSWDPIEWIYLHYILLYFEVLYWKPDDGRSSTETCSCVQIKKRKKCLCSTDKRHFVVYVHIFLSSGVSKNRNETKLHFDLVFCARVKRSLSLSLPDGRTMAGGAE